MEGLEVWKPLPAKLLLFLVLPHGVTVENWSQEAQVALSTAAGSQSF